MMSSTVSPNYRKLLLRLLAGAVFGSIVGFSASSFLKPMLSMGAVGGSFALAGVGLIYAMMGLFVGVGSIFPTMGARLLNVADRDDLDDQRAMLIGSAASTFVLGAGLILLALSGPQGAVPGVLAVSALAFGMVLMTAVAIAQWRLYDELMRGVSLEGAGYMAAIIFPVQTMWAALAHIGSAPPIEPLGLIAVLAGSVLAGMLIAVGRRGLLLPT